MGEPNTLQVIDSHTAGEPTRVVVSGGPDLGRGSLVEQRDLLRERFDWLRAACVNEPRGHDAVVGALLCEPMEPDCAAGVVFFNNVGYLNGCVHGTMGVTVTLARMGRLYAGRHRIETPVGVVEVELHEHGRVSVVNVPSYRLHKGVEIEVAGWGLVAGDIAWGGNWFFLIEGFGPEVKRENIRELTEFAGAVRHELERQGITGADGEEVDHIELFGNAGPGEAADSRNFVLCPGMAYDRSPCGTGTSAKLACLYADGLIGEGESWHQASILGTVFEGQVELLDDRRVIPRITGSAFVNAEATLVLDPADPFRHGINS